MRGHCHYALTYNPTTELPLVECKSTPREFEPLRAEPNGFLVHLLSRSDTVSCLRLETKIRNYLDLRRCAARDTHRVWQSLYGFTDGLKPSSCGRAPRAAERESWAEPLVYTSRPARVILAKGPCYPSLRRSNLSGRPTREIRPMGITYSVGGLPARQETSAHC
jgi:hypothetical protein